ncbi:MAG: sulfotransferase domain-containing protein [Actinomycetota bacterium]
MPATIHNRHSKSIILYLPYASGGASIRRIITRLTGDQYRLCETDMEAWMGNENEETYRIRPTGHIYIFFDAKRIKKAVSESGLRLEDLRYLVCLRDPRDLLVSLYFLTQDTTHLAIAEGSPVHKQMLQAAEKAAATPIDEYVLASVDGFRSVMEELQQFLAEIPQERVTHLSYATLCHAFPFFLAKMIDVLGASPSRSTVAELLETEDIERPKTLHRESLAHFPKASPKPGRHKRDLHPHSVRRLYQEFKQTLSWMASNDLPEFRELYS